MGLGLGFRFIDLDHLAKKVLVELLICEGELLICEGFAAPLAKELLLVPAALAPLTRDEWHRRGHGHIGRCRRVRCRRVRCAGRARRLAARGAHRLCEAARLGRVQLALVLVRVRLGLG